MKTSSASRGSAERAWGAHPNGPEFVAGALGSPAGAAARGNRSTPRVRAPLRPTSAPPARTLAAGIEISITHDLQSVEAEWRELEKHAEYTAFQAFNWLATWQRHIGALDGVVPAVVLGRHADGHLLFILPLAITGRGRVRKLTWLGWDLSDYNAPILARDFSRHMDPRRFLVAWRVITALLRKDSRLPFHVVDLQKMPQMIGSQENPFLQLPVVPNPSGAYSTELGQDWETFYAAKRSAVTRRRDRTKGRRLAEYGAVRWVEVQSPEEIERTMDTLIEQKARSFAEMGVANLFAPPGRREFFLEIAANPELRELVHVSRLEVGSAIAATNLGLMLHGCYYHVLSSYGDAEWSRFGPGAAHLHALLRHTIERGFHRFDFTIGDEPYKREWCDSRSTLYDHYAAVSARGWPILALYAAARRTKRVIKQTSMLWSAFSTGRALAGSLRRIVGR
jgi:CelD/BcsL family acetyltransferase involved in cellulose biosynthesis